MKNVLFALTVLVCFSCYAQDPISTHAYAAACGSVDAKLDSDLQNHSVPTAPVEGQAMVYLIQRDDQTNAFCLTRKCGGAIVRLGMDGSWVGITSGNSYVALPVAAGEHHLCANWQSHFKKLSHHEVSLHSLSAEVCRTYYFRIRVSAGSGGADATVPFSLSLEPLDEDEAKLLLEVEPRSVLKN